MASIRRAVTSASGVTQVLMGPPKQEPGFPEPFTTVPALYDTVKSVMVATEVLLRRKGDLLASAVRVRDLETVVEFLDDRYGPWSGACPGDDQTIPIYNCAAGGFGPSTIKWDSTTDPTFPAYHINANILFEQDEVVGFFDGAGGHLGGVGNPAELASDELLFVGSEDITQWSNPSTRRPVLFGGSKVTIDAGTECNLLLPGVTSNDDGYNLELLPDGESLVAVPNPPPNESWSDTSASNGASLIIGVGSEVWQEFPTGGASQPELLEVTVPSGTAAGNAVIHIRVRVENISSRTGNIILGASVDGATPTADHQHIFIIPANFVGNLEFSATEPVDEPPSDVVVTVWYQATGDDAQFDLLTDTTNGDHSLDVAITHGSGGSSTAAQVTYDPANDPISIATNVQDALEDHAALLGPNYPVKVAPQDFALPIDDATFTPANFNDVAANYGDGFYTKALTYSNTVTNEAAVSIPVPIQWNGNSFKIRIQWAPSVGALFGETVRWRIAAAVLNSNVQLVNVTYGSYVYFNDTCLSSGGPRLLITNESPSITYDGSYSPGALLSLRVARVPGDSLDTLDVPASIVGMEILFPTGAT